MINLKSECLQRKDVDGLSSFTVRVCACVCLCEGGKDGKRDCVCTRVSVNCHEQEHEYACVRSRRPLTGETDQPRTVDRLSFASLNHAQKCYV